MKAVVASVALALQILVAAAAGAATLAYEFRGLAAGTLDGSPFPLQDFRIRLLADDTSVSFTGTIWTLPATSALFELGVSGAGSISTPLFTNVNPSSGSVVLADAAFAVLFFTDPVFLSYTLIGPIGPIESSSTGLQQIPLATSTGTLVLTAVSDVEFEAPEPGGLTTGAIAVAAIVTLQRHKRPGGAGLLRRKPA